MRRRRRATIVVVEAFEPMRISTELVDDAYELVVPNRKRAVRTLNDQDQDQDQDQEEARENRSVLRTRVV